MNNNISCPACDSKHIVFVCKINNFPAIIFPVSHEESNAVPFKELKIVKCKDCHHLFQHKWDDDFIKEIYGKWYKYYPFSRLESMSRPYRDPFEKFVQQIIIEKLSIYKKINLLEIGCGDEAQLGFFLAHDIEVASINPSIDESETVRFIKGYYGVDRIDEKFDLLVSRFSLEHITDVKSFFDELRNNIKDDGSVIIQVPNVSHFMQSGMINIFAHEHIHYFSPNSLVAMALKNGFIVRRMSSHDGPSMIIELNKTHNESVLMHINNALKVVSQIKSIFSGAKKNVVIYGAGLSLAKILYDSDIVARFKGKIMIVDDNESVFGKVMPGMDISISGFSSCSLDDVSDIILALNSVYHEELVDKIRSREADVMIHKIDSYGLSIS